MRHRHLTRERYELALEEDGSAAARYRRQAETCPECSAALAQAPLASLLAAWVAPASIDGPVDWEAALRRAIAPSSQRPRRGWLRARRLVAAAVALTGLLLLTALSAAASTGPKSVLFPVRGVEEDVRWQLTPEPDRAALEAELASAYLWQARTSAARHDSGSYQAAMQRFFTWAGRLQTDIRKAPPAQRSSVRESVSADLSLVSPLTTSGPDTAEARRAQSIIDDVQTESEEDGQHRGGQLGSGSRGQQTAQPPTSTAPAPQAGEDTPTPGASGEDSGYGRLGSP
jgi:hypothetical protein